MISRGVGCVGCVGRVGGVGGVGDAAEIRRGSASSFFGLIFGFCFCCWVVVRFAGRWGGEERGGKGRKGWSDACAHRRDADCNGVDDVFNNRR